VETGPVISFIPVFRKMTEEILEGSEQELIATKFHNTVISAITATVSAIREKFPLEKVVLSGGVFQNRYLVEHLVKRLKEKKFNVYLHAAVPPNDGGLALGQLMIAAKRREIYVFGRTGEGDQRRR